MASLMIIGGSVLRGQDGLAQGGAGGAGVQADQGGEVGADPGDGVERDGGERPVPFGGQGQEPGGLGRLPRVRRGRRPRYRDAAAGGDRAFLQHPGAEPGQSGGGGQGQPQQPPGQSAEDGERGGGVGGQRGAEPVVAREGPGADDADEGVAGQGVGDRRQDPDGQVPPAGSRGDRVHEHAGADRGQVQRPGAQCPAAVQSEGDAEAGEDQGGGVRDGGLEGGYHGEVAGRFGHPVLGGEAHRRRGRGQDAQAGGGVAQPQAGAVLARVVPSGPGDFSGAGAVRDGRPGRAGQNKQNAGDNETVAGIMANQNRECRAHDFCHDGTIPSGRKGEWRRGGGPRDSDRNGSAGREFA
jgi:hypothetical protein